MQGPEWYRTEGFREIALIYGVTDNSFRKTAALINRIRHQMIGATPYRTLYDATKIEGHAIEKHLHEKIHSILDEHRFNEMCQPKNIEVLDFSKKSQTLTKEEFMGLAKKCQLIDGFEDEMLNNPVSYENNTDAVNISVDDILVKKQKDNRVNTHEINNECSDEQNPEEEIQTKKKRAYISNTIACVEKEGKSYTLNGDFPFSVFQAVLAFLLNNHLIGSQLIFWVDGNFLYSKIIVFFSWHHKITVILDWYHLEKKCKELLSMACKGKQIKNPVLMKLRSLLWHGLVDQAIKLLKSLPEESIKNKKELTHLINYLEKNRPMIPVYAIRKGLGLRNSSNRVEKANDLVVAKRQKHKGISWNKIGSMGLATITSLKINNEYQKWLQDGDINFKLAA